MCLCKHWFTAPTLGDNPFLQYTRTVRWLHISLTMHMHIYTLTSYPYPQCVVTSIEIAPAGSMLIEVVAKVQKTCLPD